MEPQGLYGTTMIYDTLDALDHYAHLFIVDKPVYEPFHPEPFDGMFTAHSHWGTVFLVKEGEVSPRRLGWMRITSSSFTPMSPTPSSWKKRPPSPDCLSKSDKLHKRVVSLFKTPIL